jgi:hypothetical protein
MENITADCDDQTSNFTFVSANCQRIEKRLGRMLMSTISGIYYRATHFLREKRDRSC